MPPSKAKKASKPKTSKKTSAAKSNNVKAKLSFSWLPRFSWRWLISTAIKLTIVTIFMIAGYGIYLDGKVRQKFEGQRWQIPAQIFGRTLTLTQGTPLSLKHLKKELVLNGYRKVSAPQAPGEFALSQSRAIIYQRSFDFGEGQEPAQLFTINVSDERVTKLLNHDNNAVREVSLEPLLLARLTSGDNEDRILVNREQFPEKLLDTLILVEDRDFYHHFGISPLGIARALLTNVFAGRIVQGGSTLTQQLAKNMFLTRQKTIWRKFNEALIAILLELRYSKDQLLEAYLNEVYLGQHYANGIYGFGLGAKFYFGKSVDQLSNAQIALLIGQIKGPSFYDPWRRPERAIERRDLVLQLMFEHHLINRSEFELAINSQLSVRKNRRFKQQNYPAYLQLVKSELKQHIDSYALQSGIKVFTGFDPIVQANIEQSLTEQLAKLEQKDATDALQSAVVVSDIQSGELRALIGDRDTRFAGFNRALSAKRQIGSLIKPAVYLTALERYEKYNFAYLLKDQPVSLKSDKGNRWQPKNYDGKYRQQVPLIDSLVQSYNVPTVNLGMELGLDTVAKTVQSLGYHQDINLNPSMLLGAINMSPLEVNQWYLTLANQGSFLPSHAVTQIISSQGETLWQYNHKPAARLSSQGYYLIDYALSQVTKKGTAKSLRWSFPDDGIAGKTGTSNDLRDSWFVGYDQQLIVTTWLGRDDNKPMGLTGSSGALTVYKSFLQRQGVVSRHTSKPVGIEHFLFETETGNAVTDKCLGVVEYPANSYGIKVSEQCLQEKERTWFEKIFG